MGWTTPRTWVTGEVVTAAEMNTNIRDNTNALARRYFIKTTTKAVTNTVTKTDLLNGELTVASGDFGTTGRLRITAWGDFINNSGANRDIPRFALDINVGGDLVLVDTSVPTGVGCAASATRFAWRIVAEIQNLASTTSQMNTLTVVGSSATAGTTDSQANFATGTGTYDLLNGMWRAEGFGTSTFNSTGAVPVSLNVINGNNVATYETKLIAAAAELIP